MIRIAAALLAILVPLSASAQTVIGALTATVDGAERSWFVTEQNGDSQSLAMKQMPGLHALTLWGNPTADNNAQVQGALILDFMVLTRGGAAEAMEPTLQWLEQGYAGGWLAVDDGAVSVTLTRAEETETGIAVEGRFSATAAYSEQIMRQVIDPSRTVAIEGTFEANLPVR